MTLESDFACYSGGHPDNEAMMCDQEEETSPKLSCPGNTFTDAQVKNPEFRPELRPTLPKIMINGMTSNCLSCVTKGVQNLQASKRAGLFCHHEAQ